MKKFFTRSLLISVLMLATSIVCAQKKVFCEDFQSGKLPTGWTTTGASWKFQNGEALFSSMLENASDTLITPIVSVAELKNNPTLTIDYRLVASGAEKTDVLVILYRTATSETWQQLIELEEQSDSMRVYCQLPDIVTSNVQIAFVAAYHAGKTTAVTRVAIENQRAAENAPANFNVDNITATTATLRWEPSTSQYWEQNYLKVSTTELSDFNIKADIYDGPSSQRAYHNLTALQPATTYYVYVRYECEDDDMSPWASAKFKTQCVPVSIPYTEGFENSPDDYGCYTIIKDSRKAGISESYPHNGEKSFQFLTDRNSYNYLFFPTLNVEKIQDYQISFYIASEVAGPSYGRDLTIGIATSATAEDFQEYKTISLPRGRQWEHITISFAGYKGTGNIIALRAGHATLDNHIFVDDVVIEKADACPRPMFVTINNVTYNSARISWVETGSASEWNMVIATKQYANPMDCEPDAAKGEYAGEVKTNPYEATNLLPQTTYYVYVQSACAEGNWTEVASFTTAKPVTLPYKEGFDRFDPDFYTDDSKAVPDQWLGGVRELNVNRSDYDSEEDRTETWFLGSCSYISTDQDHTGSAYVPAALLVRGSSAPSDLQSGSYRTSYMMLPAMPVDVNKLFLSFYAYSGSKDTRLIVGVADVQSYEIERGKQLAQGGNVTPVDTLSFTNSDTWTEMVVDLTKYKGKGRYITFYVEPAISTPKVYIDDISIDYAPTCFAVQNLSGKATSITSLKVTWKETLSATSWNVKVSSTEIDPATTDGDVVEKAIVNTTPEYVVNNLKPNTTYYVYVSPACGELWSATEVTTLYALMVPYYNDFSTEPTGRGEKPQYWITGNRGPVTTNTSYIPYVYSSVWTVAKNYSIPAEVAKNSLYFYAYYSSTATRCALQPYAIMPELFNAAVKDVTLSFWGITDNSKVAGYSMELKIGVMTDPTDFTTLTEVTSVTLDTIKVPQYFIADMSSYTGSGKYIVFYIDNQTKNTAYFYLDNLNIALTTKPRRVTNVQAIDSTITETSAKLKWHENGDAKSWKIRLFTEEQADPSEAIPAREFTASDTVFEVNGLTHSTRYYAYVQAVKGADTGMWSLACPFWTKTGIWNVPFFEDFENYTNGGTTNNTLPKYYDLSGSSAKNFPYVYSTYSSYGGGETVATKKHMFYMVTSSSGKVSQIIFPKFDKPVNTLQMTFLAGANGSYIKAQSATQIGIITADGEFHVVAENQVPADKTWYEWFVDFSSYTGEDGQIAIRIAYNETLKKNVYVAIDNISIVAIPECKRIATVKADAITTTSATILWDKADEETAWNLKVSTKPLVSPSDVTADIFDGQVTSVTKALDNLDPNTTYYVYVQTVRADKNCVGEWSQEMSFTTLCLPVALPYTEDFEDFEKETIPDCFTLSGDVKDKTATYISEPGSYDNGKALYLYQVDIANKNYCAFPPLDCKDASELQLRMLIRPSSTGKTTDPIEKCDRYFYEVGVMTDPKDPATYVSMFVDSVIADGTTYGKDKYYSFQKYSGDDYGGMGKYITIKVLPHKSASLNKEYTGGMYIDDVKIERVASCVPPTELRVVEFDNDTVALAWNAVDKAGIFRIRIFDKTNANPDVDTPVKDVVVTDTTSVIIKDFNGNTTYYAFIRKECSATDFSTWSQYATWHTDCDDIQTLPYMETFEACTAGKVPNCWSQIMQTYSLPYGGGGTQKITISAQASAAKDSKLGLSIGYSSSGYAGKKAASAITPRLNISSFKDVVLYFDAKTSYSKTDLKIEAVESPATDAAAIEITTIKNIDATDWKTYYLDLADYYESAQEYQYLRFTPTNYTVLVDNIHITTDKSAVIPVQALRLQTLTDTTATFSFVEATPNVKQWVVEYGPKEFALGSGTKLTVDTTVVTLQGLTDNTAYDVYVHANVQGTVSYTGPLSFTTAKTPATLPYYYGFEDANENANLWSIITTANFKGDSSVNQFAFGDAALVGGTGKTSLYIQHDGICGYATNDADPHSYGYAVRYINIPVAGTYTIGMRAKNYGNMEESKDDDDFFAVSLAPASVIPSIDDLIRTDGTTGSPLVTDENRNEFNVIPKLYREPDYKDFANNVVISTPGVYQLLLYWQNYCFGVAGPAPAIDSVWVEECECTEPSAHNVVTITDTSATLSWFAGANDKFEVIASRYTKSPRPDELDEQDMVAHETYVGEPTYTITGLKPHTSYAFYQRTICSDHATEWHELDFTTNCVMQTLPFTELFAETPECWILSSSVEATTVDYLTQEMEEAEYDAEEWNCLDMPRNSYIVLPDFGVTANRLAVQLNVFNGSTIKAVYEIGVVTSPYNMESFKPLQTIKTTKVLGSYSSAGNPYEVESFTAMLHRYKGTGHYIAIRTSETEGGYIKDLTVTLLPECVAPQLVEVTKIAETTAQLSWIAGNETEWSLALNTDTFTVYENPYLLTNLKNGTDYSVSVRAHCDATHASEWTTPVRFTTKCGVNSLPLIERFEGLASPKDYDNVLLPLNCWSQKYTAITLDSMIHRPNVKAFTDVDKYSNMYMQWVIPYQSVFDRHYNGVPHLCSDVWMSYSGGGSDYKYNYKWLFSPKYKIEENTTLSFDLAISTLMGRTMHVTAKDTSRAEMGSLNIAVTKDGVRFTKVKTIDLMQYDSIFRPVQVDLSAFTGDTLMVVLNHGMKYDYYAFNYPSIRINNVRMNCTSAYAIADNACEGYDYQGHGFTISKESLAAANMSKPFTRFAVVDNADNECDSIITLTLTTLPSMKDTIYRTICEGESFLFDGRELTEATPEGKFYFATFKSSIGCDSTVYLQLTVNPRKRIQWPDVTIKYGESYSGADGHFVGITEQGIYRDTLTSAQGCDSIIELRLFVTQPHSIVVDTTVCENNLPFTWHDIAITEAGIYPYAIAGAEYDSVVNLNVKVNAVSQKTITEYICQGDSILFDGKYRYAEDTYTQTLVNALGCDSVVTLNLFVTKLDTIKLDTVVLTTALPFVFEGKELLTKETPVGVYDCELVLAPATTGTCSTVYQLHITVKAADAVDNIDVPSLHIYPTLISKGQSVNLILDAAPANNDVVIEVRNMVGQLVATYRPTTSHVVLSNFHTAGMYFVRVTTNATVSGVGRVIVK